MRNSFVVHILQSLNQLLEVEATNFLGELSSVGNIVKELTTCGQFEYNVDDLLFGSILFFNNAILPVFYQVDDVGMAKLAHCVDFSHDQFEEFAVEVRVSFLQYFHCKLLA